MMSASAKRPETTRSKILLRACVGRTEDDLESLKSSEFGSVGKECEEGGKTGAHLRRNCRESKLELLVIASGCSATESTMGLRIVFISELVRDSGSFSQSTSAESASGVLIDAGSLI